jgi:hypothetical protein
VPYVVTAPEAARGIYETWPECQAAVRGKKGAKFMKVADRAEAELILTGGGVVLAPGLYAFTDGNHYGGVGIVIVRGRDDPAEEPETLQEVATTVYAVFEGAGIRGLASAAEIQRELEARRNILAEMAGLYGALQLLPDGAAATAVYDYEGVGAFMEGRWKPSDEAIGAVVQASHKAIRRKGLAIAYLRQAGHRSNWAGRHDFARFNGRADELATAGGR